MNIKVPFMPSGGRIGVTLAPGKNAGAVARQSPGVLFDSVHKGIQWTDYVPFIAE
jgi:hypothetical protein